MAYEDLKASVDALHATNKTLVDKANEILEGGGTGDTGVVTPAANAVPKSDSNAHIDLAWFDADVLAARIKQVMGDTVSFTPIGLYDGKSFGVTGGTADMTAKILKGLAQIKADGGGTLVCRSTVFSDPIVINGAINIEGNNTTLIFLSPVQFGPDGYVRFNGRLAELYRTGQVEAGKLSANTYANAAGNMVVPMVEAVSQFFQIGDRITLRGQNDKNGAAIQRQITTIIAKDGFNLVCADEPDYTFKPTYPDSDWPSDLTTGTTVIASVYSQMTADSTTRTDTVAVADSSVFSYGDLCYISDSRTEADMMSPEVTNLLSQVNMEIYRIVGINMNGTTNTITFERELLRDYLTAFKAGVTKMDPVKNSHIIAEGLVTWPTPQTSRKVHSFAANYGQSCTIKVANSQGKSGKLGSAARIAYSYDCHIYDSKCYDSYRFESAEGYGLTLYYSTMCTIRNSVISGMRHNILLQTCTSCDITDNFCSDDYISGIDLHGARSMNTRISRNRVGRSRNFAPGVTWGGGIRNGNTAHTLGDHGTLIEDNIIEGYRYDAKASAIDITPCSQNVIVRNNHITDCWNGVHHYVVGSGIVQVQTTNLLIVEDNTFLRCDNPTLFPNATNSILKELIFTGNKSVNNSKHFEFKNVPTVRAYNNEIIAPIQGDGTVYAFTFDTVTEVQAYGNICGKADRGILCKNVTKGNVVRNFCQDVRMVAYPTWADSSDAVVFALNGNDSGSSGGGSSGGTVVAVNGVAPDGEGNVDLTSYYGDATIDFLAQYLAG